MLLSPFDKDHRPILVAVTDVRRLQLPVTEWTSALFDGGVDIIQVREPALNPAERARILEQMLSAAPHRSRVQINDDPAVAQRIGCGLHLPERSPDPRSPSRPFSRSVHDPVTASQATGCDFLIAGHIFATPSHPGEPGRGLDWLASVAETAAAPVIAIGGIDASNAVSCLEAGARGVAVIRSLSATDDPATAARTLRAALDNFTRIQEQYMNQDSISIALNGKSVERPVGSTVQDLLRERELVDRLVVVEVNGAILSRSAFADTVFSDGDIVELVHFVGGG